MEHVSASGFERESSEREIKHSWYDEARAEAMAQSPLACSHAERRGGRNRGVQGGEEGIWCFSPSTSAKREGEEEEDEEDEGDFLYTLVHVINKLLPTCQKHHHISLRQE